MPLAQDMSVIFFTDHDCRSVGSADLIMENWAVAAGKAGRGKTKQEMGNRIAN